MNDINKRKPPHFYEKIARFHRKTSVGNPKDKPIEAFFNRLNQGYFRLEANTSGQNITSQKNNQPNMQWLDKHKNILPGLEEDYKQIECIIARHRAERQEAWLSSFRKMLSRTEDLKISRLRYLELLGKETGYTNRLSNMGIAVTLDGVRDFYDLADKQFRRMTYTDWQLLYDPANKEDVLAIDPSGSYKFLLTQRQRVPMSTLEQSPADKKILTGIWGL